MYTNAANLKNYRFCGVVYKIRLLNHIAHEGLERFDRSRYQIDSEIKEPDAWLVRSFDLRNTPIPESLKVVGRAGVGVNTIPIDELTRFGIPVMNTPGANANAVKELVITGMLLASRNICAAWDYTRGLSGSDHELNIRVEKEKKQFSGFELPSKTLGVVGLGKIGVKVANAAVHLGMRVIGYDPAITVKSAWELSSEVHQSESLRDLLKSSDFITLHVPLNEHTHHFINEQNISWMKKGAVLLNFARDKIVHDVAVLQALQTHHLRYYVCDFPSNVLIQHPEVICLPHLGASTKEAEINCAVMIADQIMDFLENGQIKNSVNFPAVKLERTDGYRLAIANVNVPNMVAQISSVLSREHINIIDMINKSKDQIAYTMMDINTKIDEQLLIHIRNIKGVIWARAL